MAEIKCPLCGNDAINSNRELNVSIPCIILFSRPTFAGRKIKIISLNIILNTAVFLSPFSKNNKNNRRRIWIYKKLKLKLKK